MAGPIHYPNPPLAGRPPFATDEPDEYFQQSEPQRGVRQQPHADPNSRTSAYNVYDNYLDGNDAVGAGFMNGDMDDDDNDQNPFQNKHAIQVPATQPIPLASPRPGYAAPNPVHALDSISRPSPAAMRDGQMSEANPIRLAIPPPAPVNVPSTPHPLQPPMTPITPIFARPRNEAANGVKFETSQLRPGIMRAHSEDTPLPRRGERGDEFWRRFSMVAKSDTKESFWLKKTQNGTSRLSRWVWVIGLFLLACIAGAVALGVYVSHKSTTGHSTPKAIGGSANEAATSTEGAATASAVGAPSSHHVSPTNTVARRAVDEIFPTPAVVPIVPIVHHRKRLNRISDLQ
ncbi:hypothetical protein OE88DRAFT_1369047 [Heliocybe sulcata]|uniref:Transmembrane protein n=1 Tax=Heliocybe sulcata TaxID=5364 RepID=A0A5C3N468_9AGAM|nr:hypothetical protein OE88DRAFT_1369047 [Heliocybe sulcata]